VPPTAVHHSTFSSDLHAVKSEQLICSERCKINVRSYIFHFTLPPTYQSHHVIWLGTQTSVSFMFLASLNDQYVFFSTIFFNFVVDFFLGHPLGLFPCIRLCLVPPLYYPRTTLESLLYHSCTTHVSLLYHSCTTLLPLLYHSCTTLIPLFYDSCTILEPLL